MKITIDKKIVTMFIKQKNELEELVRSITEYLNN